jgi:acetoin utilization deacetylase AcuC-like enzyme
LRIVFSPAQLRHAPRQFLVRGQWKPCPEVPERADELLRAVEAVGHEIMEPRDSGTAPIEAVHAPDYLRFLETAHARWTALPDAAPDVVPNVHPVHGTAVSYPDSVVGQAGFHMADTACPITAHTWEAVYASAQAAVQAADLVREGAAQAYALCRPPGHHAFRATAGGFCYLNNSAIAAEHLRRRWERVAILDVDLHHGNGTQGIFYARGDVLTISVHADPASFYPFFWGHRNERGEGPGHGYNINLPLPLGSGDAAFLAALDDGLATLRAYAPGAVIVALGLDAFEGDPFAGLRITTEGFAAVGRRIAGIGLPTVLVQEGGYLCDALGENLVAVLSGFA